ncbi:hypothetical protein XaC1_6 [Xanthomonas phage XaC1]|nr:hypothetical protein XaC1_6 [Xanthomonas phage XaC1]
MVMELIGLYFLIGFFVSPVVYRMDQVCASDCGPLTDMLIAVIVWPFFWVLVVYNVLTDKPDNSF